MEVRKYYCDKCKREIDREKEGELKSIWVHSFFGFNKHYDLCTNCMEKLGLIKKVVKNNAIVAEGQKNAKDRLYDIFAELVQEIGGQQ